jgi:hypothetical protein
MRKGTFASIALILFLIPGVAGAGNNYWEIINCPKQAQPGWAVRLTTAYHGMGPAEFRVEGWDQRVVLRPLQEKPGFYEGFLAVPVETPAGDYPLTLTVAPVCGSMRDGRVIHVHVLTGPPRRIARLTIPHFEKFDYDKETPILVTVRKEADYMRIPVESSTHSGF